MLSPHTAHLLIGIIISGFVGLVFGNFSTSPIYRLPRKESLFLKDPYCGDCNAKLQPVDLFPVFSWVMTKGKCRYCGAQVPVDYAIIEGLVGVMFVLCYLKWGFTERFVLAAFAMTAFVMLAAMMHIDNFFSGKTVIAAIFLGVVYRALQEHTVYNAAGGAFAGLLVGGIAWKMSGRQLIRDIVAFPGYMQLLIAAGVWLPTPQLVLACIAAGVARLLSRGKPWITEYAIIAVTVLGILLSVR